MKRMLKLLLNDIKDMKWAIIVLIAYFALSAQFLYSTCPVIMLTGFPCPACGLTRAAFLFLHLDFYGAWQMHPFLYGIIILAAVFFLRRYVFAIKNDSLMKWAAIMLIIGMTVYYIFRMVSCFPGDAPMSYYEGSVLSGFLRSLGVR